MRKGKGDTREERGVEEGRSMGAHIFAGRAVLPFQAHYLCIYNKLSSATRISGLCDDFVSFLTQPRRPFRGEKCVTSPS